MIPPSPPSTPLPSGTVVGGCRIVEPVGQGGVGRVYRAEQLSLHREVALKILHHSFAKDPRFVEQFLREARAAAGMNHPNVVQVYDAGRDGEHFFYAMEFLPGGSLEERLRAAGGHVGVAEALRMTRDAARGLDFAERQRLVHGDLKPANLMLGPDGSVKILDLGLATTPEQLREEASRGRRTIRGTPHFIAPEQARGGPVDGRTDLYALGVTLFRLLTGHTPFEGSTTAEIVRGHLERTPPSVRDLDPAIPDSVADLVKRMLEKDPSDRIPSAKAVLETIESIEASLSSSSRTRTRLGPLLAAVAVTALAAAGWMWLGGGRGASREFAGVPPPSPGDGEEIQPPVPGDLPSGENAAAGAELEQARREKLFAEAERALLEIEVVEARGDRNLEDLAARYASIPERFPGTPSASTAREREEDLQRRAAAEQREARRLAARDEATRIAAQETYQHLIAGGDLAAAARFVAESEMGGGDPPPVWLAAMHKDLLQELTRRDREASTSVERLLALGKPDEAVTAAGAHAAALGLDPPAEELPLAANLWLEPWWDRAGALRRRAVTERDRLAALARRADHEKMLEVLGPSGLVESALRGYRLAEAVDALHGLRESLRTDAYRSLAAARLLGLERARAFLATLLDHLREGSIRPDYRTPYGRESRLEGLDEDGRLRVRWRSRGAEITDGIPLEKVATAADLEELLHERWDMTPRERLDAGWMMLEVGGVLDAVALRETLSRWFHEAGTPGGEALEGRLQEFLRADRLGDGVRGFLTRRGAAARQGETDVGGETEKGGGGGIRDEEDSAARAALQQAFDAEQSARGDLRHGLDALLADPPRLEEALETFESFAARHAGTRFHGWIHPVVGGFGPPLGGSEAP